MPRPTLLFLLFLLPLATSLSRKSPCTTDSDCDAPLSCLGPAGGKRCFQKKPVGMRCALDPFWVCEDNLICQNRVCKIPVAGACNNPADVCEDALDCLGNPGKRRCEMKKGPGMRCGTDPFWVCRDGLTCVDSRCRTVVTVAESCNDPDDVCEDGLDCLGNPGKRRCEMKKGPGMRCGGDPFWVCADGLTCTTGRCATTTIPTAGECNNPGDICEEGLSCIGVEGNKKCFMKKQIGMRCGADPFWHCDDKLACVNLVCRKTVGRGKRCGKKRVCRGKFVCAGEKRRTVCVRPGKIGKACGDFETCRNSTCVDAVCV